jgi:S1-C subfamily serine protease
MENPLAALSDHLANTVSNVSAITVAVLSDGDFVASGIIWKPGVVVTTDHALKKSGRISLVLPEGKVIDATLKGRAKGVDVMVLEFETPDTQTEHAGSHLGDPKAVRPGQLMLVAGRSLDTGVNATMGVVSAVSGAWRTWRGGQMDQFIRLDVALFPGVNGGAVTDPQGRVIGLATNALSRIAGVVIPVQTVNAALDRILAGRKTSRGYLGVGLHEVDYEGRKLPIILSVEPGGAAAHSGLVVGDLITSMDGKEIAGVRDVWTALLDLDITGREIELGVLRGGQPISVHVTVGERAESDEEQEG